MHTQLDQLKQYTTVVADTGDINTIKIFNPQDATTNPSLILKASKQKDYQALIAEAIKWAKDQGGKQHDILQHSIQRLVVIFGREILTQIPGRVSIELDSRLSFDVTASVNLAKRYIQMCHEFGLSNDRILIKLAATWEGFLAAKRLEAEGIHCNLTLIFSFWQAIAAAQVANTTLISPFVGRILDFQQLNEKRLCIPVREDKGVLSVKAIYHYYKKFGYKTQIMGASFRNKDEILALAGCDLLTIAPVFLQELQSSFEPVTRSLCLEEAKASPIKKLTIDEASFRWHLNEDEMATIKLREGISQFAKDTMTLEQLLLEQWLF